MLKNHRKQAARTVACHVITVSDTRTEETDKSGKLIQQLLADAGHSTAAYAIVTDDAEAIEAEIEKGITNPRIDAIILNGGTGIAKRDVTIEIVQTKLDKEMPGFGEIFRFLSYRDDIGTAAILSRATAGTARATVIFAVPGSTGAVRLAMESLILPEIGHVVGEVRKDL
ncbi:molybdenum cofactor biosynthesis protein B [Radiobacillus sp. PE A8.2]|uniref:MogA/MoaB family molybdenum cofactor biosynthesis protein n=1 Tax=Radiobacillus sp. PE A8.2 TaxID=3380349 RepID=UPI00388F0B77